MKVYSGKVIYRRWHDQHGLSEVQRGFRSIEEMFSLCLPSDPKLLVERIVIDGEDDSGAERTLTLVFQSTIDQSAAQE